MPLLGPRIERDNEIRVGMSVSLFIKMKCINYWIVVNFIALLVNVYLSILIVVKMVLLERDKIREGMSVKRKQLTV